MRKRILASILCMGLVLVAATGCGMKLPTGDDASSSPGDTTPPPSGVTDNGSGDNTAATSIYTAIVSAVNEDMSLSLDIVKPYDADEHGTDETTSVVTVGASVYAITGESLTISLAEGAEIILSRNGYSLGGLSDIMAGDLIAAAINGSQALTVIDNGPGTVGDAGSIPDKPDTDTDTDGIPETGETMTYSVATDTLNVRSEPDTTGTILGKLAKGKTVTGTIEDGWLKFTYEGHTAYCSAEYLTVPSSDNGDSDAGVPDSSDPGIYRVATDSLNIRDNASTDGIVLGRLSKGGIVEGTVASGWLKFTFIDQTAYCSADYLTNAVKSTITGTGGVPDTTLTVTYAIVAENLNIRSGPALTDSALGTLPKGTLVTGTVSGGWLKFHYNGRTAYCKATYLAEDD